MKEYRFRIGVPWCHIEMLVRADSPAAAVVELQKELVEYSRYGVSLDALPGRLSARVFFDPTAIAEADIREVNDAP